METGYVVRYDRGEGWEAIDIGEMTSAQFTKFMSEQPVYKGTHWAVALHKWIIDNVEEVKNER